MNHSAQSFRHRENEMHEILSREAARPIALFIGGSISLSPRATASLIRSDAAPERGMRDFCISSPFLVRRGIVAGNECGLENENERKIRVLPHLMARAHLLFLSVVSSLFFPIIRYDILPWKRLLFTARDYLHDFLWISVGSTEHNCHGMANLYSIRYNALFSLRPRESGSTHASTALLIPRGLFCARCNILYLSIPDYCTLPLQYRTLCAIECLKEYLISSLIAFVLLPRSFSSEEARLHRMLIIICMLNV